MVYQSAQSGEIKKSSKSSRAVQILLDMLTLVLVAGATYAIFRLTSVAPENQESNNPEVTNKTFVENDENEKDKNEMWLARTIGGWLETFSRDFRVGVEVYDLDNDWSVGEAYADELFSGHIISDIGVKFGVMQNVSGATSAREMTEVVKAMFRHADMGEDEWKSYKEILLAQPEIYSEERCHGYCKVRAGLPAGFSNEVKVYNENYMDSNGSYFEAYRDVALVEFPIADGKVRSFAITVLGYGFSAQKDFANLAEMLERKITTYLQNE